MDAIAAMAMLGLSAAAARCSPSPPGDEMNATVPRSRTRMNAPTFRYLNNAGTSWPRAPGVAECVAETLDADPRMYGDLFEDSRASIAASLGAPDPARLLLTPSCTAALATTLHKVAWQRGDVVVTSAVEHQAVLSPIASLVATAGVEHRSVPYRGGDAFDLDAYAALLATGRVRAVVVTAASNVTGECLPVDTIGRAARQAGAFFMLDAAQVAGLLPLDVAMCGADAVAFAGHKGARAPLGVGGLWLRAECEVEVGYCDVGSVDLPSAVALAHALRWQRSPQAPPAGHATMLRNRLREGLVQRRRVRVLGGVGESTGTLSASFDGLRLEDAEAYFAARGVSIRAGSHCAPAALRALGVPQGVPRFSFGQLNVQDDVAAVLSVVDSIALGR